MPDHSLETAQEFARVFNAAAYKLRGYLAGAKVPDDTVRDVELMVGRYQHLYDLAYANGLGPASTAKTLTDLWWDKRFTREGTR